MVGSILSVVDCGLRERNTSRMASFKRTGSTDELLDSIFGPLGDEQPLVESPRALAKRVAPLVRGPAISRCSVCGADNYLVSQYVICHCPTWYVCADKVHKPAIDIIAGLLATHGLNHLESPVDSVPPLALTASMASMDSVPILGCTAIRINWLDGNICVFALHFITPDAESICGAVQLEAQTLHAADAAAETSSGSCRRGKREKANLSDLMARILLNPIFKISKMPLETLSRLPRNQKIRNRAIST